MRGSVRLQLDNVQDELVRPARLAALDLALEPQIAGGPEHAVGDWIHAEIVRANNHELELDPERLEQPQGVGINPSSARAAPRAASRRR